MRHYVRLLLEQHQRKTVTSSAYDSGSSQVDDDAVEFNRPIKMLSLMTGRANPAEKTNFIGRDRL